MQVESVAGTQPFVSAVLQVNIYLVLYNTILDFRGPPTRGDWIIGSHDINSTWVGWEHPCRRCLSQEVNIIDCFIQLSIRDLIAKLGNDVFWGITNLSPLFNLKVLRELATHYLAALKQRQ